jgi:hypothetical protein
MMSAKMDEKDWALMMEFIHLALEARTVMQQADAAGKKQVSLDQQRIKRLLEFDPPLELWIRYGYTLPSLLDREPKVSD